MYNELRAFEGCASAVQAIDAPKLSLCKADRNSYDDCFKMLDIRNRGVVSIDEAVPLFRRAKIDDESLNDIFDLAEVGDDNMMTLPKFRVAMHLAAKLVCGYDLPETLPESLARSAGIVGGGGGRNSSPMSIPSWIQLRGTGWAMTPEKRAKYTEVFRVKLGLGEGGHAQRQQAVRLFKRSKLPQDEIDRIWRLADADRDQQLSRDEFCNAMHLVTLRKSGTDLPPELPSELMSDDVKWELTLDHSMNFGEQFRALAGGQHPALSQDAVRQHLAQYGQPTQYVSRVLEMVSPYGQTVDEPHFCMANLLMLRLMSGEPMPSALPERVREQVNRS
uniref:Calmodulin n=1 Tax=Chrysotila carterae TaxID=13221 RepID=A0A7S4F672_CHRCT